MGDSVHANISRVYKNAVRSDNIAMDPRRNPFSPGAGTRPPELAGRDELLERASIALDRIRAGRAARSVVLYGLRGVGKTVL